MKTLKKILNTETLNVEELMMIKGAATAPVGCKDRACNNLACNTGACPTQACSQNACNTGSCNGATCTTNGCTSSMDNKVIGGGYDDEK